MRRRGVPVGARPLLLATLGDGGMAGVGAHTVDGALPVQLGRRVADATGRPVHVVSAAVTGAHTADVLAEQVPRLPAGPDVVLMGGPNNVIQLTPWPALARSTAALLDALTRPVRRWWCRACPGSSR